VERGKKHGIQRSFWVEKEGKGRGKGKGHSMSGCYSVDYEARSEACILRLLAQRKGRKKKKKGEEILTNILERTPDAKKRGRKGGPFNSCLLATTTLAEKGEKKGGKGRGKDLIFTTWRDCLLKEKRVSTILTRYEREGGGEK